MKEFLSLIKKWMTRLLAGIATVLLSIIDVYKRQDLYFSPVQMKTALLLFWNMAQSALPYFTKLQMAYLCLLYTSKS